ncbi:hypothetical protein V1512DRAFT_287794 [Lipomyces arxii]|uniref:uncharacterized protein n=1 Tax=Lipomyces arxii TaxID=56418 RepID=UPI0034CE4AFB
MFFTRRPRSLVVLGIVAIVALLLLVLNVFNLKSTSASTSILPFHIASNLRRKPNLVVFGDSWSDDGSRPTPGDVIARVSMEGDLFYPQAQESQRRATRFGKGPGGRWSDGPVWPEYLCETAHCDSYINLAYGGAKVTNEFVDSPVPDLLAQDATYREIRRVLANGTLENHEPTAEELAENRRTLFVFWFGINDLIQYVSTLPLPVDRHRAVVRSVKIMFEVATALQVTFPGSNFLFMSSIDVTLLPVYINQFVGEDAQLHKFREAVRLSQTWHYETTVGLGNWDQTRGSLQYWDANKWYARSISGVVKNGFKNVKDPCFDHSDKKLCSSPETYFFWDTVHLTTAAHKSIARQLSHISLWPEMSKIF